MEWVFFMIFVAIPHEYIRNFLEVFSFAIFYKNGEGNLGFKPICFRERRGSGDANASYWGILLVAIGMLVDNI